jgi:uncharacterized protein
MSASKMIRALRTLGPDGLARAAEQIQSRLDAWKNEITGFGTGRDKTTYSQFSNFRRLSDIELSNLYHGDPTGSRMVDVIPEEMLREGFQSDIGDLDANSWLSEKHRELDTRQRLLEGERWGGLYGGAAIIIGADDGRPADKPLIPERVRSVRYLYVLDRRFLYPLTYYQDPGSARLGKPETYIASPVVSSGTVIPTEIIHESRMILFGGAPTGLLERAELGGWDYSILQRPHEVLLQFNTGWKALEVMLTDANQAVFKMAGLADAIASDETEALQTRIRIIDLYRSVMRAMVVDAGNAGSGDAAEDFTRHAVSFTDIPQTLDKLMLRLASAVQIPVTILMGQSPAGMSATGDSDFRWFYDRIRSRQNNELAPKIRRIDEILLASKESPAKFDPKVHKIKFPALWTLDPLQEAQRRAALATADAAYVAAGVYLPEEIALNRSTVEGFGEEIALSDEARKAREEALTASLEDLGADEPEDEPELAPAPSNEPPLDEDDDGSQAPPST